MSNLRDRLNRIKDLKKNEEIKTTHEESLAGVIPGLIDWQPCGYKVLKRNVKLASPFKSVKKIQDNLKILIPDLEKTDISAIEDFIFFDLETTGLGGAGTVAFLAAFGSIISGKLNISQYLLLDYPGENDFLANVLDELKKEKKVIVSFNGKCFDSQIIKTRCLMNRIKPPLYSHADLLHPSRRLWKNIIHDCSQGSIEANILGIERKNDIPGSMAPDIWFEFLKTGATERLIGICDHNLFDITGLASILAAMISISRKLFEKTEYEYDAQRLARFVYKYAYRQMLIGNYKEPLELIKKGMEVIKHDELWYNKLLRRKIRLEKLIKKESVKSN